MVIMMQILTTPSRSLLVAPLVEFCCWWWWWLLLLYPPLFGSQRDVRHKWCDQGLAINKNESLSDILILF